ncbi:MAG: glycosyltransferase family 4 protein [Planctomycetaceae bacterium]
MRVRSGIGRYVAALAQALAGGGCDLRLFGVFRNGNVPEVRRAPPGARLLAWRFPSRAMDLLGRLGILPADRALGGCDLFHHTNYVMAVASRRVRQVMTIHDLAWLAEPGSHHARATAALTAIMEGAKRACAGFLVPSEATARDCEERLGLARDRLFLTPLGVDPAFFALERRPRTPPYLLAVGTIEPRKNYARLLRAFDRVAARRDGVELFVAGRWGWEHEDVRAAADGARARERIHLLGHVSEELLLRLMTGAAGMLYPSLLEGFGLPVLEAMAAGIPLLTSDREPLRSLADGAALRVDPTDEEAIAAGIEALLEGGVEGGRGRERARGFTWEACAAATLRAYREVLA